ncbi:MAG: hypothetical protein JXR37_24120 [Kiritimatiellae bacterium]|nr:hypothetical protein [Kiritimatiellia bacterium]
MKRSVRAPVLLLVGLCAGVLRAKDFFPVIQDAKDATRVVVAGMVLGEDIGDTRARFAAKQQKPVLDTEAVLEYEGAPVADEPIGSVRLYVHQYRLYKIVFTCAAGREAAPAAYARLRQAFSARYGTPDHAPEPTGTFEEVEWNKLADGDLKLTVMWKEDPGHTTITYLYMPVYQERLKDLTK